MHSTTYYIVGVANKVCFEGAIHVAICCLNSFNSDHLYLFEEFLQWNSTCKSARIFEELLESARSWKGDLSVSFQVSNLNSSRKLVILCAARLLGEAPLLLCFDDLLNIFNGQRCVLALNFQCSKKKKKKMLDKSTG